MDSKIPVAKPQKFDQKAYAVDLKKQRDSLKSNAPKVRSKNDLAQIDSTKKQPPKKLKLSEQTDTLQLKITYGKVKMDTVKLPLQKMVFMLDSDTANKLKVKITPIDSTANIQIVEIIDSNGSTQGPFGKEIEIPIDQKGIQKIVVSESQFEADSWGGRFTIEVKLGW